MKALLSFLFSLALKYSTGLGGYSGRNNAPTFGDLEAQRHWMEITTSLPANQWYSYQTQYWGLDYPPLTAYHSLLLGKIGKYLMPESFDLDLSRGSESEDLVLFMRLTALLTDVVLYTSALLVIARTVDLRFDRNLYLTLLLTQPALIIIDHGHFQYNSAMLGFVAWSMIFVKDGAYLSACVAFCFALLFKQMALYFALPIFFYLLGICLSKRSIALFIKLGASVIITFTLCLLPLFSVIPTIFNRIFPVARGLFEDKVANFWCATNVIIKWKSYPASTLIIASLVLTLAASIPSCIHMLVKPTYRKFKYAMCISSLGFFLFSFQVHEKSILLPLLPMTMMIMDEPFLAIVFNNCAMFTLWPLLYFALLIIWNVFASEMKLSLYEQKIVVADALLFLTLHILEILVQPPARYPDLWVVINCAIGAAHFGAFFLSLYYKQFRMDEKIKLKKL